MVTIKTFSPQEEKRWNEFIESHNLGTVFHTSHWAKVIQKTYGFEPLFFINTDGDIKFGFPFFLIRNKIRCTRLVCLPFTDECPPLLIPELNTKGKEMTISAILETIKKERIKQIEIRGGEKDLLTKASFVGYNYYRKFYLDLSKGIDLLWKGFKQKSIRYPIKKAQSYGIRIAHSTKSEDMTTFYKLNLLTRKKHGVLPQPYKFFLNIYQEIINKELGFISIAYYNSIPIASSIFFTYNKIIHYKYNASNVDYLRYQPNHLILWDVIQWGVTKSYKTLDLGRTTLDNKGLMSFKRHWGAQEFDLPYYYWPEIKGISGTKESSWKYRAASLVLRKTPIPILKIAGKLFYKHLG